MRVAHHKMRDARSKFCHQLGDVRRAEKQVRVQLSSSLML